MNLGLYGYLAAASAYGIFTILLLFSLRESLQGRLLFVAMLVSAVWALVATKISLNDEDYLVYYKLLEVARYMAWYAFLLKLFDAATADGGQKATSYQRFIRWALPLTIGFSAIFIINELLANHFLIPGQFVIGITGNVILSLISLAILEQLFRNMSAHYRWATKFLFLAAGGVFAYDFYMYTDALLFRSIDQELWEARGFVHLAGVPLLAIASARSKNWSLNIFVSRDIVLNTTAILAGGVYLLAMAGAGYYLREFGGSWGKIGQIMLLILAVIFLFALLSSTQLRAQIKVFLGKHFYKNKYDYRIEWLRLIDDLNEASSKSDQLGSVVEAMANIVDARAGQLWLRDESDAFINAGSWQASHINETMQPGDSLIDYLERTGYIINLLEIEARGDEYEGLELPVLLEQVSNPWLIIPLHGSEKLLGFIVLAGPMFVRAINWEDRDLLKAAAKQVSSHLMVIMTSDQLAQARQFEVFSRLSAYMVHDLKNIAAELELISINAKKHTDNPAFIEDAFETVENASSDINRLLEQLRNKRMQNEKKVQVELGELVTRVVQSKHNNMPVPVFNADSAERFSTVEKSRLTNVVAHLIDNAQQATQDDGEVVLSLSTEEKMHVISIKDTGQGMDEEFVRNRLFKAFDTTKGNAGMGIGMFESREFIRGLGGDIQVKSKPGKGSIISLYIPATSVSSS